MGLGGSSSGNGENGGGGGGGKCAEADDLKTPVMRISQAQVGLRRDFWLWLARLAMNIERELFSFFPRFFFRSGVC